MNYDDALARIEAIVKELEQAQALSPEQYKQRADEARQLLDYCEQQLITPPTA